MLLPILTGVQSAMWSNISSGSIILSTLINMFCYMFLAIIYFYFGEPLPIINKGNIISVFLYLIVLMVVANLWRQCSTYGDNIDPSVASFAEISWPIFTLFFLWLFYGIFSFNKWQLIGGLISIIGAIIVALNMNSK